MGLNWIFGLLLLLGGLVLSFVGSALAGIVLGMMSILLLPPVRDWVYAKTGKKLPTKIRVVGLSLLFVLFAAIIGQDRRQASEQAERQRLAEDFNANSQQILSQTKTYIDEQEYQKAVRLSSKYLVVDHPELSALNAVAKEKLAGKTLADSRDDGCSPGFKEIAKDMSGSQKKVIFQVTGMNFANRNCIAALEVHGHRTSRELDSVASIVNYTVKPITRFNFGLMTDENLSQIFARYLHLPARKELELDPYAHGYFQ